MAHWFSIMLPSVLPGTSFEQGLVGFFTWLLGRIKPLSWKAY